MVSDKKGNTVSIRTEHQRNNQKIVALPYHLKDQVSLSGGLSKADRIRGVARSLVVDALTILNEMWEDCQKSPELRENYYQLYHCLDYLKRFCDGKV